MGLVYFIAGVFKVMQMYFVTNFYANASTHLRVAVVLAYQPLYQFLLMAGTIWAARGIVEQAPWLSQRPYYYLVTCIQTMLTMTGRMYLTNIEDLGTQAVTCVLLAFVEVALRSTLPLRAYILWVVLGKRDQAEQMAKEQATNTLRRHAEYLDQCIQLMSIIAATVFSAVVRAVFAQSQPPSVIIGSLVIQLVAAALADVSSMTLQSWYLGMSIKPWLHHQQSNQYLRTLLLSAAVAPVLVQDWIQVASSG